MNEYETDTRAGCLGCLFLLCLAVVSWLIVGFLGLLAFGLITWLIDRLRA